MKRPPITSAQGERVAEYREAGCSFRWIARKLDLSVGAVQWHCLKNGVESPNTKAVFVGKRPMTMVRGDHSVRRFTADEDATILRMSANGSSAKAIGKILGRNHNSIMGRLATLARREERIASYGIPL